MSNISQAPAYTENMFKGKWKGRLGRKDFLIQSTGYGIASIIALALIGNGEPGEMGWIIGTVFGVSVIPPFIVTHIKRFHDLGFNGLWVILEFSFFANILIWPILYFLKGNVGPNLYGFDPLIDYEAQKKLVEVKDGVLYVKKIEKKTLKVEKTVVANPKKVEPKTEIKSKSKTTTKKTVQNNNSSVDEWDF